MTTKDQDSEKRTPSQKHMRLNYYGGTTTLGGLPRDPGWLKEILRFFGIGKDKPSDKPEDDKPAQDY